MKKLLRLNVLLLLSLPNLLKAQAPFNTLDWLDINNIKASQLVHGDMWNINDSISACEFPKGTRRNLAFVGNLWLAGYDNTGQLRVSAQTYRSRGLDYWPGPLYDTSAITYSESQKWARIWRLDRWQLEAFLNTTIHTTLNTSATILEWPAKGNIYAKGNNGSNLSLQNRDYAPFVDVNQDGIYNALDGDYPEMKGDEMLWYIFCDHGATHTGSKGEALNVEISCTAYAYKRNTLVDNVLFYEYSIANRNNNALDSFIVGIQADLDLGYSFDDYFGFDSSRNLAIAYNGDLSDGIDSTAYRDTMPKVGVKMLLMPGDVCGNLSPAGSFMFYNNANDPIIGDPTIDTQFHNYLTSRWRNGAHLEDWNHPGIPRKYLCPDDPSIQGGWSECGGHNPTYDRRIVIASQPQLYPAAATIKCAFALVASPPVYHNSCPNTSFQDIQVVADTAQNIFCNPLPVKTSVQDLPSAKKLNIYPNPATDNITIEGNVQSVSQVKIIDAIGKQVAAVLTMKAGKTVVDIAHLPTGIYHVLIFDNYNTASGSFIKE